MLNDEGIGKVERSACVQAAKLRAHASRLICPRPFQVARDFDDLFIGRFVRMCFTKDFRQEVSCFCVCCRMGSSRSFEHLWVPFGLSGLYLLLLFCRTIACNFSSKWRQVFVSPDFVISFHCFPGMAQSCSLRRSNDSCRVCTDQNAPGAQSCTFATCMLSKYRHETNGNKTDLAEQNGISVTPQGGCLCQIFLKLWTHCRSRRPC